MTSNESTDSTLLDVERLAVTYGSGDKRREVLADLSLTVNRGELVSIVGPSGAGKTTLLRCLSGLQEPTGGVVRFEGTPIDGPPEHMAVVFQDYSRSLLPWKKLHQNVALPLRHKRIKEPERRQRAEQALEAVGLHDVSELYPWQLSGGMQQRVAIARALAYDPAILLMDEPFASLDAQTRAELEDLLLRLRREFDITVIFVTHDIDESVYLADRVVVLGGVPTTVRRTVQVDLPAERDQLMTKSLARFIELRAEVLQEIQHHSGHQAPTPAE